MPDFSPSSEPTPSLSCPAAVCARCGVLVLRYFTGLPRLPRARSERLLLVCLPSTEYYLFPLVVCVQTGWCGAVQCSFNTESTAKLTNRYAKPVSWPERSAASQKTLRVSRPHESICRDGLPSKPTFQDINAARVAGS